jgi:hypothetical protein
MSNIITTNGFSVLEVEAMQKLPSQLKLYVQAKNETKIINLNKQDVLTKLYALIIKTIELSGENKKYNLEANTIKNVAGFIYDYVIEHYKGATLTELENAFNLGLTGEYGQYVGYGTVTFSKFIKGYMSSQKREQAMKEWFKMQDVRVEAPVTKFFEQNMEIAKYFFKICEPDKAHRFGTIINHEDNVMHLPSIYKFLFDNFQISFSDESKEKIKKQAKINFNNFLKKSEIKRYDEKGYNSIVLSVIDDNNKTFEYYVQKEALIFLTLKLKEQGKTYDNLKPLK